MWFRRGRRAVLALAGAGALVLGLPMAMASATEAGASSGAPSNLRVAGQDRDGFPVLVWDRSSADNRLWGYYEVQYVPEDGGFTVGAGHLGSGYQTQNDIGGYCMEAGEYDIRVRFVQPSGERSAWSNAIEADLPGFF